MTHSTWRWLTLALAAAACGQAQESKSPIGKWPIEIQFSLDSTGYAETDATGPGGTFKTSGQPRLNPGIRASFEPFCIEKGRLQFSLGYRFGGEVDVEHGTKAPFEMKDQGQLQVGVLYLYPVAKQWELGVGLDGRNDAMRATGTGTPTEYATWRGYVRGVLRYNFDWKQNRSFFVALEGALPLGKPEVNAANYYLDYANLTGTYPAGLVPKVASPESLTRGHFSTGSIGLAIGMRWGNYSKPCGGPVMPPPVVPPPVTKPEPTPAPAPPPPPPPPAPKAEPVTERVAAAEETRKAPEVKEIEGLIVRFGLNRHDKGKKVLDIVRAWAKANKEVLAGNIITVTGHCDESGPRAYNEKLSLRRANAVADALRKEGIAVEDANVAGKAWDVPEVPNTSEENRAKNRRGVVAVKEGVPFKVVKYTETPVVIGIVRTAKETK